MSPVRCRGFAAIRALDTRRSSLQAAGRHPLPKEKGKSVTEQRITSPLRLAAGSHEAGTGVGCVMNVVSWVKGDYSITDNPTNIPQQLASLFQEVNDLVAVSSPGNWYYYDDRRDTGSYVPAKWATRLLDLAFSVVGTTSKDINLLSWMINTNKKTLPLGVALIMHEDKFLFVPCPGPWFKRRLVKSLAYAVDIWLEMALPVEVEQPSLEAIENALKEMAVIK